MHSRRILWNSANQNKWQSKIKDPAVFRNIAISTLKMSVNAHLKAFPYLCLTCVSGKYLILFKAFVKANNWRDTTLRYQLVIALSKIKTRCSLSYTVCSWKLASRTKVRLFRSMSFFKRSLRNLVTIERFSPVCFLNLWIKQMSTSVLLVVYRVQCEGVLAINRKLFTMVLPYHLFSMLHPRQMETQCKDRVLCIFTACLQLYIGNMSETNGRNY